VQPFADAFDRGDYVALHTQLNEAKDLANVVRAVRTTDGLWPDNSRRQAVFALELSLAALRHENGFAREQGLRLLAEYTARVRQPRGADAFECTWLWAEVAGLGGLFRPNTAIAFVNRAVQRCPDEPRLRLAEAIIAEQQWASSGQPAGAEVADLLRRYEAAMKFSETALEARVRAASLLSRTGGARQALALLEGGEHTSPDPYVRYLADLMRGRVLHLLGRTDDAIAVLRSTLATWPAAQSARVALMALLLHRGDRQEAATLAEAVQTAPADEFDPWSTYWYGDFRAYPSIIASLRELAR
jgi:tetratricopeptide (TPR) repeat protein